jgi:hypothetical protein
LHFRRALQHGKSKRLLELDDLWTLWTTSEGRIALALQHDASAAEVKGRTRTRIRANPTNRQAHFVSDALLLLADHPVSPAAVLAVTDFSKVLARNRLQDATATKVITEFPHKHTRHVPAREVRVGRELSGALFEARQARVPLDALLLPQRMACFETTGVGLANVLGRGVCCSCCHNAQEEEVVHFSF